MAFPSVPSKLLSPSPITSLPTSPLFFLKPHPQTHSSRIFRPQKLKILCCQQTVEIDIEAQHKSNFVKKRKPRPSFLEQIQSKWSVKNPSLRVTFPWQEQENREFEVQRPSDVSSHKESKKTSSVNEPPVISRTKTKSTLAPWIHGNGSDIKVCDSEGSRKSEEPLVSVTQGPNTMLESGSAETPIGPPPKINEISKSESVTTLVEDLSTTYRAAASIKHCSVDANDSKRLPWERRKTDEEFVQENKSQNRNTVLAERLIPGHELKRLRNVSLRMSERMRVGAAGVTQALVEAIHEKWKHDEVVKLKFEGPPSMNMKRTHEFLESRTGGLVIWRSGGLVVLYRGMAYKLDCIKSYSEHVEADDDSHKSVKIERVKGDVESSRLYVSNYFKNLSKQEQVDLHELDRLLDELGPRFVDWSGYEPLPVDADLLPAVVPGYKTPFRLLPHGTKQALRDKEMTYLRQTARMVPPHFALGRSRELQGLAKAMVKLWEKSTIAKIAIKRGVQNTSNERMAEELKILTGGTLLSRNKEFVVFYRGNDFLPPNVSSALVEAEKIATLQQEEEEQARQRAATLIDPTKNSKQRLVAGTLAETIAATSRWGNQPDSAEMEKMMREKAVARHAFLVKSLQNKLDLAKGKIRRAEKALQKVLENQEPEDLPMDLETLTDEERFLFRKIGLSMKPFLELGRREIFDGIIENMHLHWKYRELVKIVVERKTFSQVRHIALSLEAESGGVLVSVEKTPKGHVIIVYRGKNYQRPLAFRPRNLLTKRQALARSIELQRREEEGETAHLQEHDTINKFEYLSGAAAACFDLIGYQKSCNFLDASNMATVNIEQLL
ncbi:chloroplastic group iia intron splicing facilitator crs1 chloroplastic [Phtheirospermum japonicum]|uniref:Chloroplastic group iia intron splicing facilitator crs1 chloroplastic n=1 Tax=Phtheirospermum japonicum TaxID=374723 RepID=A0A830BPG9_9LAMI|nr:chloroplastic group iia intron splicing facilitator crs1 chloroplastic [Phtheirospermum japonicum]